MQELLFVSSFGTSKVEVPEGVADFIIENKDRFELFAEEPIMLIDAVKLFAEQLNTDEIQLIRQEWWKKLRAEAVWSVKY